MSLAEKLDSVVRNTLKYALFPILIFAVLCALIFPGFLVIAFIGTATGWYQIEDHMCKLPEQCQGR